MGKARQRPPRPAERIAWIVARPDVRPVGQHRHGPLAALLLGERHIDVKSKVGVAEAEGEHCPPGVIHTAA